MRDLKRQLLGTGSVLLAGAVLTSLSGCALRDIDYELPAEVEQTSELITEEDLQPDTIEVLQQVQQEMEEDEKRAERVARVTPTNRASVIVEEQARTEPSYLTEDELAIFNNPEFRRQFALSYLSETDIEPELQPEEVEVMQEVLRLMGEDKLDSASEVIETYQQTPEVRPSAVFDFTQANIHFQREDYEAAAANYNAAIQKFPKYRRAWKNLALIHIRNNDFEQAIPALRRTLELGENTSLTYGLMGYAYSSTDDFLAAESAYRMAVLLDPDTLDWKMGLARAFFKQNRYPEAIALTQGLLESNPEQPDIWLLQANAYLGKEQSLEAAEIYEIVDAMGGSTRDSLNMLGDIYINEGLFQLATNSYLRAMDMDEEASAPSRPIRSARVLAARGALDETQLLIEKIQKTYSESMELDDQKNLLKLKARMAVAEGASDEEVRVLEEIVELDPLDGEALLLLGQHAMRADDVEKAMFYYERAAKIESFEADANVRQAQLLVGQEKYEDAIRLLRRAQQIRPRDNIQEYLEQVERIGRSR